MPGYSHSLWAIQVASRRPPGCHERPGYMSALHSNRHTTRLWKLASSAAVSDREAGTWLAHIQQNPSNGGSDGAKSGTWHLYSSSKRACTAEPRLCVCPCQKVICMMLCKCSGCRASRAACWQLTTVAQQCASGYSLQSAATSRICMMSAEHRLSDWSKSGTQHILSFQVQMCESFWIMRGPRHQF